MKNKITRQLINEGGIYMLDGELALCGKFVDFFLPIRPSKINVTISQQRMHRGRTVWIRLESTEYSHWSWRKYEVCPFYQSGILCPFYQCGIFPVAREVIEELIPEWVIGEWYKMYVNVVAA